MRNHRSLRGFRTGAIVGVLIGVLIGSAGMSMAAFGYQGWQRFSNDFKTGYVTGFLAMASLARNLNPNGWVDMQYPDVPAARPMEWVNLINDLYRDPANQNFTMTSIMMSASYRLQDKYGKGLSPDERTTQRMLHQLEILRKKREAAGLLPGQAKASPVPPKVAQGSATAPKPSAAKAATKKPAKKWCRCDGKDPKAARAARKAAAAAKEAAKASEDKTAPKPAAQNPAAQKPAAK